MIRSLWLALCLSCLLGGCARKAPDPRPVRAAPDPEESREAEVARLLASAGQAMDSQQYDTALNAYSQVLQLSPDNLDAQAGKVKAEQALVSELIERSKSDLERKRYEQCVVHLSRARKLDPKNQHVAEMLEEAERALRVQKTQAEAQLAEQVGNLLRAARAALAVKNLEEAGKQLAEARKLAPNDPAVVAALKDLDTAIEQSPAAIAKRKQRQEDYKLAMDAGRSALRKEHYQGAINSFTEALRVMPNDADAADLLRLAQRQLNEVLATEVRKEQYTKQMKTGQTAMAARKYQDAVHAFSEALKQLPGDPLALKGHGDATAALKVETDRRQREAQRAQLLKQAREAIAAHRYDDAIKQINDALKVLPDDREATSLLQQAQTGKSNFLAQQTRQREEFNKLLESAQAAMTGKKYAEAVKLYGDALKLFPSDAEAKKSLDVANKEAAAAAKRNEKDKKQRLEDYKLAMDAARDAIKKQNYTGAVNAFKEALRLMPGDKDAQAGLQAAQAVLDGKSADTKKKPDFDRLMSQGKAAAAAKKFDEAVKAYTDALKIKPNDPDATAALKRAKEGKP